MNFRQSITSRILGGMIVLASVVPLSAAEPPDQHQERFFETNIRPLLVQHCFEYHGEEKQQAGLRLDSRTAILKGNDTGPVVVPGKPEESRLIQVLRYSDDDIQMPPKGKLNQEQIAFFKEWIQQGAYWPSHAEPPEKAATEEAGYDFRQSRRSHWAFRPILKPPVPAVRNRDWAANPLDRFILKKLEENGLSPSPQADRRTLILRATFDLLGLPPSYEEVEAFVNDPAPNAWQKLVDRLLASPHYGERWGRHWLDIARYADTKGYVFADETRYPFAYTYRDYVIRAFNEDVPYDGFIIEQIAADRLKPHDSQSLAALGFLTVGRRFRNSEPDIIDDRIDVVTRGLMGLTVSCARCHDHKYDPLPTEDYYSLYGVFASSFEPEDMPLLAEPELTPAYLEYKKELDKRQTAVENHVAENHRRLLDELRSGIGDYLRKVVESSGEVNEEFGLSFNVGEPRPQVVAAWKEFLANPPPEHWPVFAPWKALAALPQQQFAAKSAKLIQEYPSGGSSSAETPPVNSLVLKTLTEAQPRSMAEVAAVYGNLLEKYYKKHKPDETASPEIEQLKQALYGEGTPTALSAEESQKLFDRATRNKLRELAKEVKTWQVNSAAAPPRAMVVRDAEIPTDPVVFLRGNPARRGEPVVRRFPRLLTADGDGRFQHGSGRLELARAIADPQNPLTARVFVNRVWLHHFGKGLVATPSDFGTRSEPPTHPKLLDYLASEFVENGWSIKKLHRRILLSATYQQSSDHNPQSAAADSENTLLWKMPRRRLGFEAMRDSMLVASGAMDRTMTGRPIVLEKSPDTGRRTVYAFVNRNNLPAMFRIFDFANPDASTGKRSRTTVPQQALFGMNSPFVIEQARRLAKHPEVTRQQDDQQRVRVLYRRILSRNPDPRELGSTLKYLQNASDDPKTLQKQATGEPSPWVSLAQILLLTNEFLFVD